MKGFWKNLLLLIIMYFYGIFVGYMIFEYNDETELSISSEMQYYQAKCQWYETKPDHKVCKAGDMVIYFNLTDENNLTEEQINELEERL